jgi:hypothetical protein
VPKYAAVIDEFLDNWKKVARGWDGGCGGTQAGGLGGVEVQVNLFFLQPKKT